MKKNSIPKSESQAEMNSTLTLSPQQQELKKNHLQKPNRSIAFQQQNYSGQFLSVTKQYARIRIKEAQSLYQQDEQDYEKQICQQKYTCLCEKNYINKLSFMDHLKKIHKASVSSKFYAHLREQLRKNNQNTENINKKIQEYAQNILKQPFGEVDLPEELMNLVSKHTGRKLKQILIKNKSKVPFDHYFIQYYSNSSKDGQIYFENQLKNISVKYLRQFDRNLSIFLKNVNINQFMSVLCQGMLFTVLNSFKEIMPEIMKIFGLILKHMQEWMLANYKKILSTSRLPICEIYSEQECLRIKNGIILLQTYQQWIKRKIKQGFAYNCSILIVHAGIDTIIQIQSQE